MVALDHLPLRAGHSGEPVRDLQRRLAALGFEAADPPGTYATGTEQAVRSFQSARGLRTDGICGAETWASLVEAGFRLGDRLLYLRTPMLRGDDVADLQRHLGALGFDAGRVDGIFGIRTSDALVRFQRNAGLTTDGICGPDTLDAARRFLRGAGGDPTTVAQVREAEGMRTGHPDLVGRRIAVGETGGLAALADATGRALHEAGADVVVLHDPDESVQAQGANRFEAEAFVALAMRPEEGCSVAFYATEGYESLQGRRLAELVVDEVAGGGIRHVVGMRIGVLRETRMPAIACELGPPEGVVRRSAAIAESLTRALRRWVEPELPA